MRVQIAAWLTGVECPALTVSVCQRLLARADGRWECDHHDLNDYLTARSHRCPVRALSGRSGQQGRTSAVYSTAGQQWC
jgi:hypothetical protein